LVDRNQAIRDDTGVQRDKIAESLTRIGSSVAIEILAAEIPADPAERTGFEREARAVAARDRPHICGIHDVGELDGAR
jgi:hypothetical protein